MGYDESLYNQVVSKARDLCHRSFVDDVEDHYAGYWDELGLSVKLRDNATDAETLALRNDLLRMLDDILPKGNPLFCWQVAFRRCGDTIEVLFPGDEVRSVSDILDPL
jgi:hypothetical protein